MIGSFKFFRHAQGISAFAEVSIEATPAERTYIEWADASKPYESLYSAAVNDGIAAAVARKRATAGKGDWAFRVISLTELPVDTKPDAVTCASTAAAWKAMGGSESDITFTHDKGAWQSRFAVG